MVGRHDPGDTTVDPDDWFSGSDGDSLDETRELSRADGTREATWLEEADGGERAPSEPILAGLTRRQLAVIAAAAVVVLLVVLAAAGVFSSNSKSPASTPPATTAPPTTTPQTQTTPPPTTPSVTLPTGVLKPGSTGADVKSLQQALASAGHSPGAIDGVYGPKTEAAVSAFQTSAGITADGIYGPATKQALAKSPTSG